MGAMGAECDLEQLNRKEAGPSVVARFPPSCGFEETVSRTQALSRERQSQGSNQGRQVRHAENVGGLGGLGGLRIGGWVASRERGRR